MQISKKSSNSPTSLMTENSGKKASIPFLVGGRVLLFAAAACRGHG
jgi:hypothetical protein